MRLLEKAHENCVAGRRVRILADHLAELIPQNASVLDVGCGDGLLSKLIRERRPDLRIRGIDVMVRPNAAVPIDAFDGTHIPAADGTQDVVMFVDVLHHTIDPRVLLREARRVARRAVLIKDHTRNGPMAEATLRFMDFVGNARFGVSLPYNFWSRKQWDEAIHELGLEVEVWRSRLGLYPQWANWLFGRSLHFVGLLRIPGAG